MTAYYSPNPLPADIDWKRVGGILGLDIVEDGPAAGPFPPSKTLTALERIVEQLDEIIGQSAKPSVAGRRRATQQCDGDAGADDDRQKPVGGLDLDDATSTTRPKVSSEFAGPFPAIAKPVGLPVVVQVHVHDSSSLSISKSPEPSDVDGAASQESTHARGEEIA